MQACKYIVDLPTGETGIEQPFLLLDVSIGSMGFVASLDSCLSTDECAWFEDLAMETSWVNTGSLWHSAMSSLNGLDVWSVVLIFVDPV